MLEIIIAGLDEVSRERFMHIALDRCRSTARLGEAALYVSAVFRLDPEIAMDALEARLRTLNSGEQTALVMDILPRLFGDDYSRQFKVSQNLSARILGRLVEVSFRTIRVSEDRNRSGGAVYSPDARDHAERARNAAFNALVETPGKPTYDALLRLAKKKNFSVPADRLRELAIHRAVNDLEGLPWTATDQANPEGGNGDRLGSTQCDAGHQPFAPHAEFGATVDGLLWRLSC